MQLHAASVQAAGNRPGKCAPSKTVRSQAVSDEGAFFRSPSTPLDLETAATTR